jgi:hypothetical protein
MSDPTEATRRALVTQINSNATVRQELEERHGTVYDSDEIREQFEVTGFAAPFMVVRRKSDGAKGSLMFQHSPRFYWGFSASGGA